MSTRSVRIESLFHEAAELSRGERDRFLARECEADPALRQEVEALLASDEADDDRLDCAAPEMLAIGEDRSAPLVGRRIGPYELRRVLAAGGMGVVYEARQENPDRDVAVKIMRSDVATPDLERRFRVESALLARLKHPAIAHVYDADIVNLDGVRMLYIALELVDGARTVREYAREASLDTRARIELFCEVCDAVNHGHQRGVIHRDLKPANILVDRSGRPKLIDFGVARIVDAERATQRTEAGVFLGTVQYVSPEQCVDARDLDVRSDVYSLGVVLYELLCDRSPYDLANVPLPFAARIVQEEPPRPSGLAGDLDTIIVTALEKDRDRRYQSASALADDLHRFLRREPIAARAPSVARRIALFARRHTAVSLALVAVFIAALAATTISTRYALGEKRARLREERSAYLANIAAADAFLRVHDASGARRRLDAVPAAMREWEWHYLARRLDLPLRVLEGPSARCEAIDWRGSRIAAAWHYPDRSLSAWSGETGDLIATTNDLPSLPTRLAIDAEGTVVWGGLDGALRRWDPARGTSTPIDGKHDEYVTAVVVLADGRVASASLDGTARLWDGKSRVVLECDVALRDLAVSPDGQRIAVCGDDGSIRVAPTDGDGDEEGEVQSLSGHAREALAVAFHPGGEQLASGGADGDLLVWDLATGREVHRMVGHESEVRDVCYLADGALLASCSDDRTVRVWDVATERARTVLYGHTNLAKCLATPDDGRRLASGAYDGTVRVWDPAAEPAGRELAGHTLHVRDLAFGADLLATASVDGTARLYDVRNGEERAVLSGHEDRLTAITFHPAGDRVATTSVDGTVRIWAAPSGRLLRTLTDHEQETHTADFAPSGALLATGDEAGRVLLFDADDFEVTGVLEHAELMQKVVFGPDSERLATITKGGSLVLWNLRDHTPSWRRETEAHVHDLVFSPDGATLATAEGQFDGSGSIVRLWDATDGVEVATLTGHTDFVLGVAFSPDGNRLASASTDGTVRLWDPSTIEEVLVLRGHESWVWAVDFSKDGETIASGGGNREGTGVGARLWQSARPER